MAKRMALGKGADALLRNINGTNTAIDEAIDGKDFISRAKQKSAKKDV